MNNTNEMIFETVQMLLHSRFGSDWSIEYPNNLIYTLMHKDKPAYADSEISNIYAFLRGMIYILDTNKE